MSAVAGIGLHQNLSLGQTLSPQMQQSLQFLQAPAMELQSLVQQEIEINPVLEEAVDDPKPEAESEGEAESEDWDKQLEELRQKDEEWREYFSQSNTPTAPYNPEAAERRQFLFDSQVEAPHLADHLMRQLTLATSNPDMIKVGEEILGNLDEGGFLKVPLVEVAQSAQVDYALTQQTLALIQTFDPVGVGARDLRECLLIQIDRLGKSEELEAVVVSQFLNELGRKKYQDIARALKVPLERVQAAAQFVATLQPRPGSSLAVQKNGDEWIVVMNDDPVPRLRISDTYKDLLVSNGHDPNLREYLKEKIRAGKFLIKCLHQRQTTIFNIATEIVKRQRGFFEEGVAHLKPLTMKYFFTPGYQTASGEVMSNTSVKDAISDLIARENTTKPLSDQEIVKILSERGIPLARRTVAKYRAELGLLPSNLRRSA
jgi:RNA polymerase sigma-54 factor